MTFVLGWIDLQFGESIHFNLEGNPPMASFVLLTPSPRPGRFPTQMLCTLRCQGITILKWNTVASPYSRSNWKEKQRTSETPTLPQTNIPSSTWKWMAGRWVSFWGPAYFQGAILVSGRVKHCVFTTVDTGDERKPTRTTHLHCLIPATNDFFHDPVIIQYQ